MTEGTDLLQLTTSVVAAHLESNRVHAADVPALIRGVYQAFDGLRQSNAELAAEPDRPTGAVGIRKSLADPTKIISMIDGKPYATLKRHLSRHGHTPDSYRAAYQLPHDYPMVAKAYSEARRAMSKAIGLGRKKAETVDHTAAAAAETVKEAAAPVVDAVRKAVRRPREKAEPA